MPLLPGKKARTSNCVSAADCGPTTPTLPRGPTTPMSSPASTAASGRSASTCSALRSITPRQFGPLSHQACAVMSSRATPRPRAMSCHVGFIQWAALDQGWSSERQAFAVTAQLHQPHAAFLHHVFAARHAAGLEPGVAAAQRRVAGERQFTTRAEDAHAVVGARGRALGRGWQQEGALRQVGPVGEVLHLRRSRGRCRRARRPAGCRGRAWW